MFVAAVVITVTAGIVGAIVGYPGTLLAFPSLVVGIYLGCFYARTVNRKR